MSMGWTAAEHAQYYPIIQQAYDDSRSSSVDLFRTILSIASVAGMDNALACLQECVTERRLAWWERTGRNMVRTNNPLMDGYKLFYENYLGLSLPKDGEIIESNDRRMMSRWSNPCPTLEACKILGLDTREICKKVYHQPVQALLVEDRSPLEVRPELFFIKTVHALLRGDHLTDY